MVPTFSRISMFKISFFAFRRPTPLGTLGGDVNSAFISLLTGMSSVVVYTFSWLSKQLYIDSAMMNINGFSIFFILFWFY